MQPITSAAGFARAIRLVMPSLRRYTRRLTRDDGEDLIQDTLMRAWSARCRFEPGSNFRAWLFRIARNSFLSGVRRSARNVQWNPEVHDRLLVSPAAQDEPLYLRDLRNALDVLPPSQREALLLVARDGLSYADAATQTGQQPGTIKSRVSRARFSLLEHIECGSGHPPPKQVSPLPNVIEKIPAHPSSIYARWKNSGSNMIG